VNDVTEPRVAMGLFFYPRGGSAQVVRYLAGALPSAGWQASVYCGSAGPPGAESNASTFFAGLDVHAVDYSPALAVAEQGGDPLATDVPLHPSFEDRPGAPDRVFGMVDPGLLEPQVASWARVFDNGGAGDAAVFHLHHLTPQYEVVARRWPDRPLVGHLHGTDMTMLDAIEQDPGRWPHGRFWRDRMRRWAARAGRMIVISPHDRDRARRLLDVDAEWLPNGVDTDRFDARDLAPAERRRLWRRWLVEDPRGWDESGVAGSLRYGDGVVDRLVGRGDGAAPTVLLYVGRFIEFKRVPLLVRAYARVRAHVVDAAPLVVWGGSPGEWEGVHPHTVAEREGVADDVVFVGWRGHDELPLGLACADAMVAPSFNEPFGQVFLEAMACGLPVVTTASGGPLSFVNTDPARPNGWLVPPDDEAALTDAIIEVVSDADERRARGANAYEQVRARYSWRALATRFAAVYESLL
jgi:glycosyltransferase involved in cell wall biosynthesis